MPLYPHQSFETVSRREAQNDTIAMLPCAARHVARHLDVQNAVATVRHHVIPCFAHRATFSNDKGVRNVGGDGRVKPGHDEGWNWGETAAP